MPYKLTAPHDTTSVIGTPHDPEHHFRVILGVGYTDRQHVADWADAHGYTVEEVDEVPAEHLARVARLDAWPQTMIRLSTADGADPDQQYRFTGPDGHTQYDIRDVVNGVTTYNAETGVITTA
jgi:hypothetical protein